MLRYPSLAFLVLILAVFPAWAEDVRAPEAPYLAVFADGTRVEGKEIAGWSNPNETPRLDGAELLNPQKPLCWLCDRRLPAFDPDAAASFVEFTNGDRLPGRVTGFDEGGSGTLSPAVPHLVCVPANLPEFTDLPIPARLRLLPRFVRRVVFQKTSVSALQPGTIFFRDGRRLAYQGLRWQRGSVKVLLEEGIREVPVSDLAEIHLPRDDSWQSYCEELARVNPACAARMVRVETSTGIVASTAETCYRASGRGGDVNGWFHVLQPAWSLDPLWLRFRSIRMRWHFAPEEWPLTRLLPRRFVARPLLGKGWPWHADRNVEGGTLQNARGQRGWGFGVHAPCELWFEIPAGVQSFRSQVGLDRLAGQGGCARGIVCFDSPQAAPAYRSKHLIGSQEAADTGVLPVNGSSARTLVLVADAAERDRPPGADPLDIRDTLDWIEPVLQLDLARLKADTLRIIPTTVLAWNGWHVAIDGNNLLGAQARLQPVEGGGWRLAHGIATGGHSVTLSAEREVTETADWLVTHVQSTGESDKPGKFEVRIDGRPAARFDAPQRGVQTSFCVPLGRYEGQKLKLTLVYQPVDPKEQLEWHVAALADRTQQVLWKPLRTRSVHAVAGSVLTPQADGSVLAGGPLPAGDVYALAADSDLAEINAIRLEGLLDDSLPHGGPGRAASAACTVSQFTLTAAPQGREPIRGRFVRIGRAKTPKRAPLPLVLAEVQVFSDAANVALGGKATQSSVEKGAVASRAIDNNTDGSAAAASFAETRAGDPDPWWEVDLGSTTAIDRVVLWHRADEAPMNGAAVLVTVLDENRKPVFEQPRIGFRGPCDEVPILESEPVALKAVDRVRSGVPPRADGRGFRFQPWALRRGLAGSIVFASDRPIDPRGKDLLFLLKQPPGQLLGRFRISVTGEKPPFGPEPSRVEVPLLP